jgi:hypothetical protein
MSKIEKIEDKLKKSQRYFADECPVGVIPDRTIAEIYDILEGIVDALKASDDFTDTQLKIIKKSFTDHLKNHQ